MRFVRWLAAAEAVDASHARRAARAAADETAAARAEQALAQASCDTRDVLLFRGRRLNAAWMRILDDAYSLSGAAAAFGRWALAARVHGYCAARWAALAQRAALSPGVLRTSAEGRRGWRLLLRQRAERVRAHPAHRHRLRRCQTAHAEQRANVRVCHTVFAAWRLATQIQVLREQLRVTEARYAPVHVGPDAWWEARP